MELCKEKQDENWDEKVIRWICDVVPSRDVWTESDSTKERSAEGGRVRDRYIIWAVSMAARASYPLPRTPTPPPPLYISAIAREMNIFYLSFCMPTLATTFFHRRCVSKLEIGFSSETKNCLWDNCYLQITLLIVNNVEYRAKLETKNIN